MTQRTLVMLPYELVPQMPSKGKSAEHNNDLTDMEAEINTHFPRPLKELALQEVLA